ncbi:hypothetical protein [Streptomyces sp. 5-10]|uniref:hypothetical protein n=1 Tax=Streptomyces sp. 5-10 TaxID=878925 RepID=UPI00168BD9DE|nr:hypothetical protein [Streptomyces sp. 5-10]MBD3004900.1 hypothetical protein [Streptomyces sp. 5-10]
MSIPDYVVVRPASDLPPGFLPPDLDGVWLDRQEFDGCDLAFGHGGAIAVATGRFEVRESDGAVAEVFEVRP